MAFTFSNVISPELAKSPLHDLVSNILGGYTGAVKASYLQPSLAEELKKSQLYNKYYGPNIESEIGLRGAHAGLLGEQTKGAHLENEALPEKLKSQIEALKIKAMQDRMFNQMLQQRLAGNQGSLAGNQEPLAGSKLPLEYSPGQGNAPFRQEQLPIQQPQEMQQPQVQQSMQDAIFRAFQQQQQPSLDDLFNKKFFGIDTFNPRNKATLDLLTKPMIKQQEEQLKLDAEQAQSDFKESSKAQADLPVLNQALEHAMRMKDIIKNRPTFFGHWIAPGLFAKRSSDPLSGEFQALLVPQIAAIEKQLSEKGNQLALKISSQKLPAFDETQASALGKIDALINTLQGRISATQDLAGGNIVRRGTKRFKFIDGHWYELKKGDY